MLYFIVQDKGWLFYYPREGGKMSEKNKGDQKSPKFALREMREKGISLADFLQILSKKERGKTAKEIAEEEIAEGKAPTENQADDADRQDDLKK